MKALLKRLAERIDAATLRERVLVFLQRVRDLGVPMIYVTHQPAEAAALATWSVVLEQGKIAAQSKMRAAC